jgi:UDP-N-acetylglucosamine 1-carboxyvinyltransferase
MEIARILGGRRLCGSVTIGGSKNACLPILAASLLTHEECIVRNVPALGDVTTMLEILRVLGANVEWIGKHCVRIRAGDVSFKVPEIYVQKMRASVCLMGALLGRTGRAIVPIPGGCVIGHRPIDLHIKGFRALGCKIFRYRDFFAIDGSQLRAGNVTLRGEHGSTVTGTINIIMAAAAACGETIIDGAAIEPEVVDFCGYLSAMGAKIDGIGTATLKVTGGIPLHGCEYAVIGDRIEAGTFICAALMTNGDVEIFGLECGLLDPFMEKLRQIGAAVAQDTSGRITARANGQLNYGHIATGPHPGSPTDLQAQFCALQTQACGESTIVESVYPSRFLYASELAKMGASISIADASARVSGPCALRGACLRATDLRASAALYLAGMCAAGETVIHGVHHLDRGYEDFELKLRGIGADVRRI